MNTLKKIIFLSNNEKNNGMAILTLEYKNQNIFGTLKVYQSSLKGDYVLGLKFDDKIIKQNVNLSNNIYNFKVSDNVDLSSNIGCVLMQNQNSQITPIMWGSEKNKNYKSTIVNSLRESINKLNTCTAIKKESHQTILNNNNLVKDEQSYFTQNKKEYAEPHSAHSHYILNSDSTNVINQSSINTYSHHSNFNNLQSDSLESLQYNIDANIQLLGHSHSNVTQLSQSEMSQISLESESIDNLYSNEIAVASATANLFESDDQEIENIIDNQLEEFEKGKHKFYDMISDQLKRNFDKYPQELNLTNLIDNSKWVKIPTDYDNKYYVVGVITSNNDIKYICYGVPGQYNVEPPIEMKNYSQWLPTDIKNPYSNGYWVMYQDADSGENVYIN